MCCVAVSAQNRKNASHVMGYSPSVEAGVSLNEYYTVPYVTTSQGYCFGNGLYIGGVAGVSFNSAEINGKSSRVLIPLLAEIKYSFIDRLASPFIGLKGGGILDCTALGIGYIVRPYVGVDIWRFSLNVGVDYETATYNYEQAKAAYEMSQASMVQVRRNLEYATITSPIDGVVINKVVEEGQTVAAGFETPTLFTIAADLTKMQVIADVDEADIGSVEEGQRVEFTVDAYPNDTFEGTVAQVRLGDSDETSSSTGTSTSSVVTYEVVITAENPDLKLKPRLTANVTIYTMERDQVLRVPNKALRFIPEPALLEEMDLQMDEAPQAPRPGTRLVWVKTDNHLAGKAVTVGVSDNNYTEILDGLAEGESVVVDLASETPVGPMPQGERSPFMPGPPGR